MRVLRGTTIALLAGLGIVHSNAAIAVEQLDDCYDVALVGHVLDEANITDLNDIIPHKSDVLYMDVRVDLLVKVTKVVAGPHVPTFIWSRTIVHSPPLPTTPVLFYLKAWQPNLYLTVWRDIPAKKDWLGRFVFPVAEDTRDENGPKRCPRDKK